MSKFRPSQAIRTWMRREKCGRKLMYVNWLVLFVEYSTDDDDDDNVASRSPSEVNPCVKIVQQLFSIIECDTFSSASVSGSKHDHKNEKPHHFTRWVRPRQRTLSCIMYLLCADVRSHNVNIHFYSVTAPNINYELEFFINRSMHFGEMNTQRMETKSWLMLSKA